MFDLRMPVVEGITRGMKYFKRAIRRNVRKFQQKKYSLSWKQLPIEALLQDMCPICFSDAPVEIVRWEDGNLAYNHITINKCTNCSYSCEVSDFSEDDCG